MAQIYWDEFFEASVTLANSQREKLIPVERDDLMYYFYFGLTIEPYKKSRPYLRI